MEHEPIAINIGNICEGALIDAFELELTRVLHNVMDLNTDARAKRSISMKVNFHPKDDRIQLNVEFKCESALAPLSAKTSRIFIGKDEEGTLYGLKDDPRQMNIFTPPTKPESAQAPVIQFATK